MNVLYLLKIIKTESEDSVKKEKIFKIYEECAVKFNQKPKSCIEHLSEYMDILSEPNNKPHNVVNQQSDSSTPLDPEEQLVNVIVEFLHNHGTHLNKTKTGEFISEPDELNLKILTKFIQQFHFVDMEFDVALRTFLGKFRLPGEAQKIDRIMEKFAHRYYEENQHHNIFPTEDQAYLLAFSLIMLNTDLHNPSIKHKMTVEQFVKNNTDTGLENDLSPEFLSKMYFCIRDNEIKMETQDTKFGNSVAIKMGWLTKQGGRIKTWKRRWFILSDGVLYYFKEKVQQEETSKACGIVPLEDIVVSESPESKKKGKFCFELSHEENTTMKAMKRNQGQVFITLFLLFPLPFIPFLAFFISSLRLFENDFISCLFQENFHFAFFTILTDGKMGIDPKRAPRQLFYMCIITTRNERMDRCNCTKHHSKSI